MSDINEPQQMLHVAKQGWDPDGNGWSTISVSMTGSKFGGEARLLGHAFDKAMRSLVKHVGGDPETDVEINNEEMNGYPVTTFKMKTPVLDSVRQLDQESVRYLDQPLIIA